MKLSVIFARFDWNLNFIDRFTKNIQISIISCHMHKNSNCSPLLKYNCVKCIYVLCKHIHCYLYRVIQNDCGGAIVQRQFRTKFGKQPPSDNSIRRWYEQFQETGCVCIPELKVRIRTDIEAITADMLQTVWNELDYRVDVCRITKGAHIEHLLGM